MHLQLKKLQVLQLAPVVLLVVPLPLALLLVPLPQLLLALVLLRWPLLLFLMQTTIPPVPALTQQLLLNKLFDIVIRLPHWQPYFCRVAIIFPFH